MLIIPAILTNDPNIARELLEKVEAAAVDRVQIDVIDGKFSNNKTVDPILFRDVDARLLLDYQLMVVDPINWVEKCIHAGADRIIGHVEKMSDQLEFVAKAQSVGARVGLGLDLTTPIESIDEEVVKDLDVVLVMSVPAGFGGQKFDPKVLDKIKKLADIREKDHTPFKICVDGGITKDNIQDLENAGADEVSIGAKRFFEQFSP